MGRHREFVAGRTRSETVRWPTWKQNTSSCWMSVRNLSLTGTWRVERIFFIWLQVLTAETIFFKTQQSSELLSMLKICSFPCLVNSLHFSSCELLYNGVLIRTTIAAIWGLGSFSGTGNRTYFLLTVTEHSPQSCLISSDCLRLTR